MDRRAFCRTTVNSAYALSVPQFLHACASEEKVLPPSDGIIAKVSAIRGTNLDDMTCDAVEAVVGMSDIIHQGETVFIKPNFVSFPWAVNNRCFHAGECTKPEILIAAAEECLNAGASRVIIGEGSHLETFDWKHAVTLDGETNLLREAERFNRKYTGNIQMACLESDSPGWTDLCIVDFSIGIESDGPTLGQGGKTLDIKDRTGTWAILVSTDIMAADATSARLMQHNVINISLETCPAFFLFRKNS
jgi:uncharacterized protein (DUF362 family)